MKVIVQMMKSDGLVLNGLSSLLLHVYNFHEHDHLNDINDVSGSVLSVFPSGFYSIQGKVMKKLTREWH